MAFARQAEQSKAAVQTGSATLKPILQGLRYEQETRLLDLKGCYGGLDFGILGEARVNVLLLNLALDDRAPLRR